MLWKSSSMCQLQAQIPNAVLKKIKKKANWKKMKCAACTAEKQLTDVLTMASVLIVPTMSEKMSESSADG